MPRIGLLENLAVKNTKPGTLSTQVLNPKMAVDPEFEALIAKFEETARGRNETIKSSKTNQEDEMSRWIKKRKSDITLMDFRIKAKLG